MARLLQVLDIEECLGVWGLPWACLMVKEGVEGLEGRGKELSLRFPALGKVEISNYFVKSWISFCSNFNIVILGYLTQIF